MHAITAIWRHGAECAPGPSLRGEDDLCARSSRVDELWYRPPDEIETQQNDMQYPVEEMLVGAIDIPGEEISLRRALPPQQARQLRVDSDEHRYLGTRHFVE